MQHSVLHHYQPTEIEDFIERWFAQPAPVEPVCGFWLDLNKFNRLYEMDSAFGYYEILKACRQMIGIIYPANDFKVIFSNGKDSFTDFEHRVIVVSVEPIIDAPKGYQMGDKIDVISAISLHEGIHAEETKELPPKDTTHQSEHFVWNVIEDVWIELLKSIEYPGYEGYFLKGRKFLVEDIVPVGERLKKKNPYLPQADQDKIEYSNRLNAFLASLRGTDNWKIPDEYPMVQEATTLVQRTLAEHNIVGQLKKLDRIKLAQRAYKLIFCDYVKKEEEKPNQGWTKSYGNIFKKGNSNQNIPTQTSSNTAAPEKTYVQESEDEMINLLNEKADNLNLKLVHASLKGRGIASNIEGNALEGAAKQYVIWSEHQKQPKMGLSADTINKIDQLLEDKIELVDTPGTHEKYLTTVIKPTATNYDVAVYEKTYGEMLSDILLLKHQFIWAKADRQYTITGLKSGDLDEHLLCEIPYNQFVFSRQRKMPRMTRDLDIFLFVDQSGSMGRGKMEIARKLAILIYEGTKDIMGINIFVYGYTTDKTNRNMMQLYEFVTPQRRGLPQFFMSLGGMKADDLTPTAEALYQVWKRGEKLGRKHTSKVFINISDGMPCDQLNGIGEEHNSKVTEIAQRLRTAGHELIHIALDQFEVSREIYNHSIDYRSDYKELIEEFAVEIRNLLRVR